MSNRNLSVHQEHELLVKLEGAGLSPADAQRVIENEDNNLAKKVVAFIRSALPVFYLRSPFEQDKLKDGWTLKLSLETNESNFQLPELADFLKKGEKGVLGEEMMARAKDKSLGQLHAEAMLRNAPAIPEDYRRYILVFPGTMWLDDNGSFRVPCLYCRKGDWSLVFTCLEITFIKYHRLVRPRQ